MEIALPSDGSIRFGRQTRRDDSPPHTIPYGALVLPDRVTSLPANPKSGDVVRYVADATNDIVWWLYYDAAATGSYKWKPLDCPELYAYIATQESTTSALPVNLATVGPSLTIPLNGDYLLSFGANIQNASGSSSTVAMAPSIGGSTPVEADGCSIFNSAAAVAVQADCSTKRRLTNMTAGTSIVMKYGVTFGAATGYWRGRFASLAPLRVG